MGAIRRNLPVISGKGMICFRNVFLRLLLSLFICTCFAEAHAERAEPLPKAFKDAQTLFEKGRWRDAEGAFRQVEEAGILRYRSRYMVALCKEKQKLFKQAEADYARLIRDDAAFRQDPDCVSDSYFHLHGILCHRKNSASQRSVLLSDCARRFPRHPTLGRMYAREAMEWLKAGNAEKARQSFVAGKGFLPDSAAIVAELLVPGRTIPVSDEEMRKLGHLARTEKDIPLGPLCSVLSERPEGWQAECLYADILAERGKPSEAIAHYDSMLQRRIGPQEEIQLARMEMIALQSTHPRDALVLYEKWIQAYPKHRMREKALCQYAILLGKNGKPAEAVRVLENLLQEFPSGKYAESARKNKDKFRRAAAESAKREMAAKERQQTIQDDPFLAALEKAEKALAKKAYPFAINEFRRFRGREIHPKWGRAWYGLGICYRETGHSDAAITAWDEVWSRSLLVTGVVSAVEARVEAGHARLEDMGDAVGALACYQDALKKRPKLREDDRFERNRAIALLVVGKKDEAVQIFQRKRDACPENSFAYFCWDRLIRLCDTRPSHLPPYPGGAIDRQARSRLYLGDIFFASRQFREAEKQYRLAAKQITVPEQAAFCILQVARCQAFQRSHDSALETYATLLRKYPQSTYADDALFFAGIVWTGAKGNAKQGEKCFTKLLQDYPDSNRAEPAHYYLAMLLLWDKEYEKAIVRFEDFLNRFPDSNLSPSISENILPDLREKCKTRK